MDIYHIFCNLKPDVRDVPFVESVQSYLDALRGAGQLHDYRLTRCKLASARPRCGSFTSCWSLRT